MGDVDADHIHGDDDKGDVLAIEAGETLVVTAAAGSVGSVACQVGKKLGLRVIGIAGGAEKCKWLIDECGVDGAIWKTRCGRRGS